MEGKPNVRGRKAGIAAAVTLAVTGLCAWYMRSRGVATDAIGFAALYIMVPGAIATYALWTGKAERSSQPPEPSPPSEPPQPTKPEKRGKPLEERWYFRYPMAAAIVAVAVGIADRPRADDLLVGFLLVVAALLCWELLIVGLVAGLFYLLFSGLAAIPVSIALIIGAIIIASAIAKRR